MFCLTRSVHRGDGKSDTSITCECGRSWLLRVLHIGRGQVQLGFEADQAVKVARADAKARAEGKS